MLFFQLLQLIIVTTVKNCTLTDSNTAVQLIPVPLIIIKYSQLQLIKINNCQIASRKKFCGEKSSQNIFFVLILSIISQKRPPKASINFQFARTN